MSSEWDEPAEVAEEREDDPGFLGGGGPAETLDEGSEEELDEHGDNLAYADDDEVEK